MLTVYEDFSTWMKVMDVSDKTPALSTDVSVSNQFQCQHYTKFILTSLSSPFGCRRCELSCCKHVQPFQCRSLETWLQTLVEIAQNVGRAGLGSTERGPRGRQSACARLHGNSIQCHTSFFCHEGWVGGCGASYALPETLKLMLNVHSNGTSWLNKVMHWDDCMGKLCTGEAITAASARAREALWGAIGLLILHGSVTRVLW